MSDELLNLNELKASARAKGYTKIQRSSPGAHPLDLDGWHGFDPSSAYASVWYVLKGNTVFVRMMGALVAHYTLS